jgi:hypothetical protein
MSGITGGEEWERISLAEAKANAGDSWCRQEYLCEFVAYRDYEGLAL